MASPFLGDGYLTFHDFAHLMVKRKMSENTEDELLEAFHVFDRDRDGHITAEELRKVMQKMGDAMTEEEIDDMITETDINGDGEIDYNGESHGSYIFSMRVRETIGPRENASSQKKLLFRYNFSTSYVS
jgi:Ca2+-binding EF-hand superfamily protein